MNSLTYSKFVLWRFCFDACVVAFYFMVMIWIHALILVACLLVYSLCFLCHQFLVIMSTWFVNKCSDLFFSIITYCYYCSKLSLLIEFYFTFCLPVDIFKNCTMVQFVLKLRTTVKN
jgi:hypothetical protein